MSKDRLAVQPMIERVQALRRGLGSLEPLAALPLELERLRVQIGRAEAARVRALPVDAPLRKAEFQVFSQFGEDGIIQHLISKVPIEADVFVEFGVEDFTESNTRFLLVNDNWRGLVIDGSDAHQRWLAAHPTGWRHDIEAITAFIDRDNINALIGDAGITGDIGVLSIDLDGNDLWILEAINVVQPRILITEYNATFGPEAAVSVPYDPGFVRSEKHASSLYWGASLAALAQAARDKGFSLVGSNLAGNNAFFVRDDVRGGLPAVEASAAWRPSRFRESRGPAGELTYVSDPQERLRMMRELPLVDTESGATVTIAKRFGV
jgi:hypothetical protein